MHAFKVVCKSVKTELIAPFTPAMCRYWAVDLSTSASQGNVGSTSGVLVVKVLEERRLPQRKRYANL